MFEIAIPEIGEVVVLCETLKTFEKDEGTKTGWERLRGGKKNSSVEMVNPDPILEKVSQKTVAFSKLL